MIERLMAINKKNEDTAKRNEDRHNKAQEHFEEFKRDVGEQMTYLTDTFSNLSDKFEHSSKTMDDRLARSEAIMNGMAQQLTAINSFIQSFETPQERESRTWQPWSQQGWGSVGQAWSQHQWTTDTHNNDGNTNGQEDQEFSDIHSDDPEYARFLEEDAPRRQQPRQEARERSPHRETTRS
jgi:hypothetical protein